MSSPTDNHGVSEAPASWNTICGRSPPASSMLPELAFSKPAMTRKSVDFPDPLSPTRATDSPWATVSEMPRSA
jgi:hypothetical protein